MHPRPHSSTAMAMMRIRATTMTSEVFVMCGESTARGGQQPAGLITAESPPSHHTRNRHAPPPPLTKALAFAFGWPVAPARRRGGWLMAGLATQLHASSGGWALQQNNQRRQRILLLLHCTPEAAFLGTQPCGRAVLCRCPFIIFALGIRIPIIRGRSLVSLCCCVALPWCPLVP